MTMAINEPTLIVKMKKNGAVKAAPFIERVKMLTQRNFVHEIVEFTKTCFDRSTLEASMYVLADNLIDQLRHGCSVKWNGLGIFRPTFRDGRLNISFTPSKEALFELRKAKVKVVNEDLTSDVFDDIEPLDFEDL